MDWTTDYFKKIRTCMQEQKKEAIYSFASTSEELGDQSKDVNLDLIIFNFSSSN